LGWVLEAEGADGIYVGVWGGRKGGGKGGGYIGWGVGLAPAITQKRKQPIRAAKGREELIRTKKGGFGVGRCFWGAYVSRRKRRDGLGLCQRHGD